MWQQQKAMTRSSATAAAGSKEGAVMKGGKAAADSKEGKCGSSRRQ